MYIVPVPTSTNNEYPFARRILNNYFTALLLIRSMIGLRTVCMKIECSLYGTGTTTAGTGTGTRYLSYYLLTKDDGCPLIKGDSGTVHY